MIASKISIETFQWMSLSVIIVLVVLKYVMPHFKFINDFKHIPGPRAYPVVGNAMTLWGQTTTEFFAYVCELCDLHKETFILWIGPNPKVYFMTPDNIQAILTSTEYIDKSTEYSLLDKWVGTGLLTSAGKKWHQRRKILTPAFHYNILETMLEPIQKVADILVERLSQEVDQSDFDIFPVMKLAAIDLVCATTMGYDLGAQKNQNSEYTKAVESVTHISMERFTRPWLHYDIIFQRTKMGRNYYKGLEVIHDFTLNIIKQRRKFLEEKKAEKKADAEGKSNMEDDVIDSRKKSTAFLDLCLSVPELTDIDVREEVDTFMFAGHDTTAGVASWTLYALGHHPEIQAKIVEEAESIGFYSDKVTISMLSSMEYLERCIKESLRLYPPVPVFARQLFAPMKTPSLTVPAGASIFINIFQQHRNADYFPNPLQYDPDRFLHKMKHPFAYVPFSAGPRNCIGQKVAMISEKILVANVLRKYIVVSSVQPKNLRLTQNIVLENNGGLLVSLKQR